MSVALSRAASPMVLRRPAEDASLSDASVLRDAPHRRSLDAGGEQALDASDMVVVRGRCIAFCQQVESFPQCEAYISSPEHPLSCAQWCDTETPDAEYTTCAAPKRART